MERMDLVQFETELRNELDSLSYIKNISLKRRTAISIKGIIGLKKNYRLVVFFNKPFNIISFSLLYKNQRIFGIDRDNRIGWHIHPQSNPDSHERINEKSVSEIIVIFDEFYRKIEICK